MNSLSSQVLSSVPGVLHAFGTRAEPIGSLVRDVFERSRPQWKQVHGVGVAELVAPGQACGDVDALWARGAGLPAAVWTADCVPVLLARADGGAVAAIHAGWRGLRARIVSEFFERAGVRPADWVACVGPAIGPCCYEVSVELAQDFASTFGPQWVKGRILDLPGIQEQELRDLGLARTEVLRHCTRCTRDSDGASAFESFRRDASKARQGSVILRTAPLQGC